MEVLAIKILAVWSVAASVVGLAGGAMIRRSETLLREEAGFYATSSEEL
jgi:hypothetical protein